MLSLSQSLQIIHNKKIHNNFLAYCLDKFAGPAVELGLFLTNCDFVEELGDVEPLQRYSN